MHDDTLNETVPEDAGADRGADLDAWPYAEVGLPITDVDPESTAAGTRNFPLEGAEGLAVDNPPADLPCDAPDAGTGAAGCAREGQTAETTPSGVCPGGTPPPCDPETLLGTVKSVGRRMDALHVEFQSKLKYDAHKEQIIDQLHRELQGYRHDLIKKPLNAVIMDIIKIVDDVRRLTAHYRQRALAPGDPQKLLEILEDIPTELEEIFFRQGVQTYALEAEAFDPARQRVIKKIETDDESKARQVAASLRPGYEWDGRIIRREMVAVYDYQAPQTDREVRRIDA